MKFRTVHCLFVSMLAYAGPTIAETCYEEDFDPGTGAIPPGWTVFNNGEIDWDWGTTDDGVCGTSAFTQGNFTGGTGEAACVDSDVAGFGIISAYLCSPAVNLPNANTVSLSFLYNFQIFDDSGGEDLFAVLVGTDPPSVGTIGAYATIFQTISSSGDYFSAPGASESLDISGYAGSVFYVCFNYGADWDWYAQVDDVQVTADVCLFRDGFESPP